MVLELTRTYFPEGTNGKLECNGKSICSTIELHGEKTRKEFPVFLKGTILLESDTATNLNCILK